MLGHVVAYSGLALQTDVDGLSCYLILFEFVPKAERTTLSAALDVNVVVGRWPTSNVGVWTELLVHSLDEVHIECCQVCIGNVLRRFDQVSIFGAFKPTVVSGLQARTRFEGCLDVAIWIKAEFVKSLRTWSWGVIAAFYSVHKTQLGRGQFKLWLLFLFAFAVLRLRFGQVRLEDTLG